jgi:hypothetical protein
MSRQSKKDLADYALEAVAIAELQRRIDEARTFSPCARCEQQRKACDSCPHSTTVASGNASFVNQN